MKQQPENQSRTPESSRTTAEIFKDGHDAEIAGRFDEARAAYETGLRSSPGQHPWRYRLGCVLMKMENNSEAELCFLKALENAPGTEAYLTNLGVSLDRQGRRDDAVRAYRRAIHQGGLSPVAHHNLGIIYAEEGRTTEAIKAFESAIALEPDAEGFHNLGLVHFGGSDFVRALSCFERAVAHDSRFAMGHYYWGLCLMKTGVYDEACRRFEQAHDLNRNLMRVPFHVGVCLHKMENYSQARDKLELALGFFPEDGRIHYQLALTCDALGLPQEARLHYSQARAARSPDTGFRKSGF